MTWALQFLLLLLSLSIDFSLVFDPDTRERRSHFNAEEVDTMLAPHKSVDIAATIYKYTQYTSLNPDCQSPLFSSTIFLLVCSKAAAVDSWLLRLWVITAAAAAAFLLLLLSLCC